MQKPLPDSTTLTSDNTSMPPAGFTPAMSVSEQPQTHAFDRAANGVGNNFIVPEFNNFINSDYIEVRLVFYR